MIDLDLRCQNCDRYLNIKAIHSMIAKVRCSNSKCKHLNNIKVVTKDASKSQINFKFDTKDSAKATTPEQVVERTDAEIKNLKAKLENSEAYIAQLEGIVDGQGQISQTSQD